MTNYIPAMWLGFRFLPERRVLFGEGGLEKGGPGHRSWVSGVQAAEAAGQEGVVMPNAVLAAFMSVFQPGPVLELSQHYFKRQQI